MKKYFLYINGYNAGPYSFEELRMMNISPYTPVWFDGLGDWRNANQVPELQTLFVPNPQQFYQQQSTGYTQPVYGTNQNYAQPNPIFQEPLPPDNSGRKLLIVLGSVLLTLVAIVIFIVYSYREKRQRQMDEMTMILDSIMTSDSLMMANDQLLVDSTQAADSVAMIVALGSSEYSGNYSNFTGGSILVQGDDNSNLQITLKYQSQSGDYCYGEISGTGAVKGTDELVMTTNEGCKIRIDFSGTLALVKESTSCAIYHGEKCTFDGYYYKQ